jgi:hypothetical protein
MMSRLQEEDACEHVCMYKSGGLSKPGRRLTPPRRWRAKNDEVRNDAVFSKAEVGGQDVIGVVSRRTDVVDL